MAVQRGVHVTHREKTAIYKLRRDASGETSPADSLLSSGIVIKWSAADTSQCGPM